MSACEDFVNKIIETEGYENKVRYLLEDFFFEEGWASKTNAKVMKDGYTAQHTYNNNQIKHFIEDFVRWSKKEYENRKVKKRATK